MKTDEYRGVTKNNDNSSFVKIAIFTHEKSVFCLLDKSAFSMKPPLTGLMKE